MKTSLLIAAAVLALPASPAAAADRPNIVLIFADDLGWKDVGYNGSDFHETPHLDRLARQGMVFHQAYAAAGNCAPSRACLLSGNYTPRHHVYAVGNTGRGPRALQRLVPIPNKSGLEQENITLADALKAAGYATGIFGKWHLNLASPSAQGFDVVVESQKGSPNQKRDRPQDPKGIFTLTRAACEFMEQNKDRPFFAYLSHHAIHSALEARPETLRKFEQKEPGKQHSNAMYAACLYDLDAGVGLLLEKLRQLELEDNTLVVFTSDNGATQQSLQEPLRGSKGGYYEGGIREPFVVRWPKAVKPGSECNVPVINVDLYPTFLAAAGSEVPADKTLDGESLLPLLRGDGRLARQAIFWHFPGYLDGPVRRGRESDVRLGFRTRPVSVIRKGDWKLHLFHEEWQLDGGREQLPKNGAVELYNLADDIGEKMDLSANNPDKRDELLADLQTWFRQTGALLPSEPNPNYDPSAAQPRGRGQRRQ
jgi:arylsulfatase A-like enzyme